MVQLCSKCSRPNPPEAVYCYNDGFALGGHGGSGPVAVASQAFVSPFVFPSGRSCRSFNELALACQEEWKAARDLFKQGYLETFFGSIGRVDLVMTARETGKFPDADRGFDQLLSVLPADVMEPPKLRVEPQEVSLGVIDNEGDRSVELKVENQGMRLLYGSVVSDAPWLALGEEGNVTEKHFQCLNEQSIPVKVINAKLRAGKPVEGKLVVDSNGGNYSIIVKAERPVKPFPTGALAGAKTPRQLCEKAQKAPKDAAPLFEKGDVAAWYRTNGWTYPVQGQVATGMAAVQQYFEALGVTQPPKVEINTNSLSFAGNPGEELEVTVEVKTPDKKPVHAYGVGDQPWLDADRAKLNGRTATLPVKVRVPNKPGETLTGNLTVHSNGGKRFRVGVTLQVSGVRPQQIEYVPDDVMTMAAAPAASPFEAMLESVEPVGMVATHPEVETIPDLGAATTALLPEPSATPTVAEPKLIPTTSRGPARYKKNQGVPPWMHLAPAIALMVAVLLVVALDLLLTGPQAASTALEDPKDPEKQPEQVVTSNLPGTWTLPKEIIDKELYKKPTLIASLNKDYKSFGLVLPREKDPTDPTKKKRLLREEDGRSNSMRVKIDGTAYKFGFDTRDNTWEDRVKKRDLPTPRLGEINVMHFGENVRVTQHVEIVPSATGELDTCLVIYTFQNLGNIPRNVSARIMLDTFIGGNDGVPFAVPGSKDFVKTMATYKSKDGPAIPDYIEAVENPDDTRNPGTVARLGLRHLKVPRSMLMDKWEVTKSDPAEIKCDDPTEVFIGGWPGSGADYDFPRESMIKAGGMPDSAVAIYWGETTLEQGEKRHIGFTYGLSNVKIDTAPETGGMASTSLALRAPAQAQLNQEFIVSAYVWNAKQGQPVTLTLPEGLTLVGGGEATQPVTSGDGKRFKIDWKVKATREGTFKIEAGSDKAKTTFDMIVKDKSIFG